MWAVLQQGSQVTVAPVPHSFSGQQMLSPRCGKELLMLPKSVYEWSLGAPAQWHTRRKELRRCPGRATRLLTAKAVICAVSEQVFELRLADTEQHSAGLSTRASRAWQVICHLLTICKLPQDSQSMESSLCPVFGNRFNLLLPPPRADWRSLATGISRLETWTTHIIFHRQLGLFFFFLEENDNKWRWKRWGWKRALMNGFHCLFLAYHQTNGNTKCIRTSWRLGL